MRSSKKHNHTMDKKRLKITLKILNDVKQEHQATKKYLEDHLREDCLKENMSAEEVIFLLTSTEKTFFNL